MEVQKEGEEEEDDKLKERLNKAGEEEEERVEKRTDSTIHTIPELLLLEGQQVSLLCFSPPLFSLSVFSPLLFNSFLTFPLLSSFSSPLFLSSPPQLLSSPPLLLSSLPSPILPFFLSYTLFRSPLLSFS